MGWAYTFSILAGKPFGECPLQRPRRRWEDKIKLNLRQIVCEDGTYSGLCPMAGSGISAVNHSVLFLENSYGNSHK